VGHQGYRKDSWASTAAKWWGGIRPERVDNVVYTAELSQLAALLVFAVR